MTFSQSDCRTGAYLEEVLGDDVEPLGVVRDSLEALVGQHNLTHLKEKVQRILVKEVNLNKVIESNLSISTCIYTNNDYDIPDKLVSALIVQSIHRSNAWLPVHINSCTHKGMLATKLYKEANSIIA